MATARSKKLVSWLLYSACFLFPVSFPAIALSGTYSTGDVVINEFMADNETTVTDQDGDYDDWIELYNTTDSDISLSGWYLSDDESEIDMWTFPDVSIPAGGFLIVWADKDDEQEGLHADLKLSKDGEVIILAAPDGTVMDQVTFEAQETDVSMGRYPDGTGEFIFMTPTFSAANIAESDVVGDVDGNWAVDLQDAILVLQVAVGMTPSETVRAEADANGDGFLGLEDAVYALGKIASSGSTASNDDGSTPKAISLNGDSIQVTGTGATVDGTTVTISSAGTYTISGTLSDGQIVVNSEDEEAVTLILNGVNIYNSTNAPIYIMSAKEALIQVADNTENYVSDSASYVFENEEEDEPNAAVFSKEDLTICGTGTLNVTANYNDGIVSKDGLMITGGNINVTSVDDGIRGKDYLIVSDAQITVDVQGDGLKSDNDENTDRGYISIVSGTFHITAGGDAIHAETNISVTTGEFTLTTGGGSSATLGEDTSAKGLKAGVNVTVDGGTFTIDSADDSVHSNDSMSINGGTFAISSGDDGMHADSTLEINAGDITITKSYEGIESSTITINGGNIHIVSSDDGINVAGGADSSGTFPWPGGSTSSSNRFLYINGGYIAVYASGDGLDANGSIEMTDGIVIVHGPTASDNGTLDFDGTFLLNGGFLVGAGSSAMAQVPSSSSTQRFFGGRFGSTVAAGTLFRIQTTTGEEIVTFAPSKAYQFIVVSSPELITGSAYTIYVGGSYSGGTETDGLYEGGTYTPGTNCGEYTIS